MADQLAFLTMWIAGWRVCKRTTSASRTPKWSNLSSAGSNCTALWTHIEVIPRAFSQIVQSASTFESLDELQDGRPGEAMYLSAFRARILAAAAWLFSSTGALAQDSFADPQGSGVLVSAVGWLQGTLLGTIATVAAVIAVATVGFMMLTGRINWRYGATVILGCFILFGASSIVAGIHSTATLGQ